MWLTLCAEDTPTRSTCIRPVLVSPEGLGPGVADTKVCKLVGIALLSLLVPSQRITGSTWRQLLDKLRSKAMVRNTVKSVAKRQHEEIHIQNEPGPSGRVLGNNRHQESSRF